MPVSDLPKFAVLFRIHYWDDTVQATFDLLKGRTGSGDLWVVPDETNGRVAVPPEYKAFPVSVPDAAAIGLPAVPEGIVMWHNNDYALYLFHRAHPDYDYYYIVEHDAVVTAGLDGLTAEIAAKGSDLVAMPNKIPEGREWDSTPTCTEIWPKELVKPTLLCFFAISQRAIPVLLAARLDHANRLRRGEIQLWPLAEGFVPIQLRQSGLTVTDLSDFLDVADYDWWPPTHLNQIRTIGDNKIVHPVLAGERYIASLLRFDHLKPISWFIPNSPLRRKLDRETPEMVIPALARDLYRRGQLDLLFGLEDFCDVMLRKHQAVLDEAIREIVAASEPELLSTGATAFMSSRLPDAESGLDDNEATLALRKVPDGYPAFHTHFEMTPWWTVDFGGPCLLDQVRIFNRTDAAPERANNLSIWTSTNGRRWVHCLDRVDDAPFGGVDGHPLVIGFNPPRPARYLRIELMGFDPLHLDAVIARGWGPFKKTEPED